MFLMQVGIVSGRYDANDPASPLQLLLGDVGPMLKAAARQLADKSPKTRMGMFTVLRTLVGVLPGSVADHVGMLVPGGCFFVIYGIMGRSYMHNGGDSRCAGAKRVLFIGLASVLNC
jgi:hypothetical protein